MSSTKELSDTPAGRLTRQIVTMLYTQYPNIDWPIKTMEGFAESALRQREEEVRAEERERAARRHPRYMTPGGGNEGEKENESLPL